MAVVSSGPPLDLLDAPSDGPSNAEWAQEMEARGWTRHARWIAVCENTAAFSAAGGGEIAIDDIHGDPNLLPFPSMSCAATARGSWRNLLESGAVAAAPMPSRGWHGRTWWTATAEVWQPMWRDPEEQGVGDTHLATIIEGLLHSRDDDGGEKEEGWAVNRNTSNSFVL